MLKLGSIKLIRNIKWKPISSERSSSKKLCLEMVKNEDIIPQKHGNQDHVMEDVHKGTIGIEEHHPKNEVI